MIHAQNPSLKTKIPAAFSARRDLESLALLFSGYPIGEPRRNNRYSDNNAYYNDVENKPAGAQLRLAAISRKIERALETTIGHSIYQPEEMGHPKQAGAVYAIVVYIVHLILFIEK
jgi:hypothetical protein